MKRTTGYNSTYKKLAVQWLNEALCFVSSSVVADSFVLRNRQLLVAAKRWLQPYPTTPATLGGGQDERLKNEPLLWLYYKKEIPYIHSGEKM